MNGEHGATIAEDRIVVVEGAQIEGQERGLPVVGVEDIGDAELPGGFEDGAAEEAVAFPVVLVFAGGRAVEGFAVEELRAVDEVHLYAIMDATVDDRGKAAVVPEGDGDAADGVAFFLMCFGRLLANLAVVRDVDSDFVSQSGELAREGADDFAEAAASGPGRALRRRKDNLHSRAPILKGKFVGTETESKPWGSPGDKDSTPSIYGPLRATAMRHNRY